MAPRLFVSDRMRTSHNPDRVSARSRSRKSIFVLVFLLFALPSRPCLGGDTEWNADLRSGEADSFGALKGRSQKANVVDLTDGEMKNNGPRAFLPQGFPGSISTSTESDYSTEIIVIVWGNGLQSIRRPDNYLKLFEAWTTKGFIVVQERSLKRFDGSKRIPRESITKFENWFSNAYPEIQPSFTYIAAGKSRGGNQAHSLAIDPKSKDKISGLICIAGCGYGALLLFPPKPSHQPALFVSGEKDWARWKVHQAFRSAKGPRFYFERSYDLHENKSAPYGTHLGHDHDPYVRLLTTVWIECLIQEKEVACDQLDELHNMRGTWSRVTILYP